MRLSDLKAGSNTKQTLLLPVASHYPIEMTVICGSCPGKTLVVTAGVHGCEYVGIETLNRLKKELDPIDLSGRIILLPLVNPEVKHNTVDGTWQNGTAAFEKRGVEAFVPVSH